jgi:predicted metal-dependent hydrolase
MTLDRADERLEHPISKPLFLAEVHSWARELGVVPTLVQVRRMTTKWASCSAAGQVTFNSEVLWQPPPFRKQVIVEQLELLRQQMENAPPTADPEGGALGSGQEGEGGSGG